MERIFHMKRTGSHHTVIAAVQTFVKKKELLRPGQSVIAAVSGGVDSMVMLNVLLELQRLWKLKLIVAHVNFGLRGRASDADERFVRAAADANALPFYSMRVDTKAEAKKAKRSVQETARDLRYAFFGSLLTTLRADVVATAHHADDNTETMLLNLLRGTGLDGMAGIPTKRDTVIRPLLCVTRQKIEEYAAEQRIRFRTDASNTSEDYTRNIVRRRIVPTLVKRINPSLHDTMTQEAEIFRTTADYLRLQTEEAYRRCAAGTSLKLEPFHGLHPFLQQSVIRRSLQDLKIEPTAAGINAVQGLAGLQKGAVAELPDGWKGERTADRILFRNEPTEPGFHHRLEGPGSVTGAGFTFSIMPARPTRNKRSGGPSIQYVDAALVTFPVIIRSWKPGDRFHPLGMKGSKKLSDLFGEQKLTQQEKLRVPVVECSGRIMWVAGLRLDERYKLTDSTTAAYSLTVHYHGKTNGRR
jgi:tRNA(Ile)-lysidine synthase